MVANCQKTQAFICRNIKINPDIRNIIPGLFIIKSEKLLRSLVIGFHKHHRLHRIVDNSLQSELMLDERAI